MKRVDGWVRSVLGTWEMFTPDKVLDTEKFNRAFNHLVGLGCHPKLLLWVLANAHSRSIAATALPHIQNLSLVKKQMRKMAQRMLTLARDIDIFEDNLDPVDIFERDVSITPPDSRIYGIPDALRVSARAYHNWLRTLPKKGQRQDVMVNRVAGLGPSAYVEVVTNLPRHEKVAQLLAALGLRTSKRQLQNEYQELRSKYKPQYEALTAYLKERHKPPKREDIDRW